MHVRYYREDETGDFMKVTLDRSQRRAQWVPVRATSVERIPRTMCSTEATLQYLQTKCSRTLKKDVPQQYLIWF